MEHYLLDIINQTTEYIEKNLLDPINLDSISDNVNVSKFHLLRIWKGATSTGLMEYVRRRRIAQSLSDLINNRYTIEFISSKYSFGCDRTYNRAFKEEFNLTPTKWRKKPIPLKILDRFNAEFMNLADEGLVYLASTKVLPTFSIAGHEYIVDIEENKKSQTANKFGMDFFYNHRLRVINPVDKDIYIGYTTIIDESIPYTLYQPSIRIDQNSIIPPDMKVKQIKTHKYGVFKYIGLHRPEDISSETLKEVWKLIFETWIKTVEFNLEEHFRFEFINYARCNKHYCECDLYIPISVL